MLFFLCFSSNSFFFFSFLFFFTTFLKLRFANDSRPRTSRWDFLLNRNKAIKSAINTSAPRSVAHEDQNTQPRTTSHLLESSSIIDEPNRIAKLVRWLTLPQRYSTTSALSSSSEPLLLLLLLLPLLLVLVVTDEEELRVVRVWSRHSNLLCELTKARQELDDFYDSHTSWREREKK